jgi:hypothetical protein
MGTTSNDPVVRSYAKAPARTITADGVTYAYRELGPKGRIEEQELLRVRAGQGRSEDVEAGCSRSCHS